MSSSHPSSATREITPGKFLNVALYHNCVFPPLIAFKLLKILIYVTVFVKRLDRLKLSFCFLREEEFIFVFLRYPVYSVPARLNLISGK